MNGSSLEAVHESINSMTPMDLFWNLNNRNTRTAHGTIGLRFNTPEAAIPETYV